MNTKAVSPLIATVLLIFFVVIAAGTVIYWSTNLLEKSKEKAESEINILEAEKKIDYEVEDAVFVSTSKSVVLRIIEGLAIKPTETKKVKITLANNADYGLETFIIRVYDKQGNVYVEDNFKADLDPFEVTDVVFEFDSSSLGEIDYFEIIPKINNQIIETKAKKFRARS